MTRKEQKITFIFVIFYTALLSASRNVFELVLGNLEEPKVYTLGAT